jgi:hypothetical protein
MLHTNVKYVGRARRWWLTSVILAIWEAEIERIEVLGQPRETVGETPYPK